MPPPRTGLDLDRPLLRRLSHGLALLTRAMTLGVRGVAIDAQDRVCLVRHTYVRGWYLPGGGVEPGETTAEAMIREFREEAGIRVDPDRPMRVLGVFHNVRQWQRDHVVLYHVPAFTLDETKRPDREIAECAFFPLDALPEGTTQATRARLHEWRRAAVPAALW